MTYRAVVAKGSGPATIENLSDDDLPDGDVTVEVAYSSLNYKDGLAVTGRGKIARRFPMVCGIDLAGTISESHSSDWAPGDEVVVTGWGLSETHPGGFTQRQRVRSQWLVRRPENMTLAQTMAIGTAGLTAALCVSALEGAGLHPASRSEGRSGPASRSASRSGPGRDVLVTGAGGGVGSVAVALLASAGHRVTAATGRPQLHDYLSGLGATAFVERAALASDSGKPLEEECWDAVVDSVGSTTLATVLRQTRYRGAVAACGLAGGADLLTTVLPFILRGVSLLGVDSVQCPLAIRRQAWERLAADLEVDRLDAMTTVEPLSKVPELAAQILAGATRGRVVIDVSA